MSFNFPKTIEQNRQTLLEDSTVLAWLWEERHGASAHLNLHLLLQVPELLSLPESFLGLLILQGPEVGLQHLVGLQCLQFLKRPGCSFIQMKS